jgi:sulfur carrier protein ThiS
MGMQTVTLEKRQAITVKIITMGAGVTNFVREEPLSLGSLLIQLGLGEQVDVRVNGVSVEKNHRLADGDQVLVVPKIRGGCA